MFQIILLTSPTTFERGHWDAADELVERDGVSYTLRAGPRQPLPTHREWDPVAVYAPEEITEEEFQDWYAQQQEGVEELHLKY